MLMYAIIIFNAISIKYHIYVLYTYLHILCNTNLNIVKIKLKVDHTL